MMRAQTALACALLMFFPAPARTRAATVEVFLLGGQSNAGGRGAVGEVADPAILQNPDVMLYHSAQLRSDQPALTWTTLRPAANSEGFLGPEIGLGNRLAELYPDRRIAIIKHAVGGTNLAADWYPGADSQDTGSFGPQFRTFVDTVTSGLDALIAQGHAPVIRGMLWQQGERDSRDEAQGLAYARNLVHFIQRVREQFDAPAMPFVYGQVLPVPLAGYDWRDEIRQAQWDVDMDSGSPYATDGARLVPADDLPMNADNLHISTAGLIELGTRYADALGSVLVVASLDFDADGKIDRDDVLAMLDHWRQDAPVFDVVPPLFGDSVVDARDLIALADSLGKDLRLLAHWKLDERAGDVAQDSAKGRDATAFGERLWLPDGGMVDGAIELDGIGDYLEAPLVLDPSDGPFSLYAWVRGGAPGQVVISQAGGLGWLMLSPEDGTLMTELQATGRGGGPLISPALIADGNWHHIGLRWDGAERVLYVDGVEAARDTQVNFASSLGDMRLGTGPALVPGTFWSGSLDDVRLYDRPLSPDDL